MTSVSATVAPLPGVTLDELNAVAALLKRTDRKYVVSVEQFADVVDRLGTDVRVLEMDGRRSSAYESMYFDTPQRNSFRSSAHRRRRRFKVRTRTYIDTQHSFIEVKLRDARKRTVKLRRPCTFEHRNALGAEEQDFVREVFVGNGFDPALVATLQPALKTVFRRTTLLVPSAGCRVTVDTDLVLEDAAGQRLELPELVILETKSDAADQSVDRLLWQAGVRPQKVSKFAIGSALLDPSLPDNKWRRTIDRHFTPATAA